MWGDNLVYMGAGIVRNHSSSFLRYNQPDVEEISPSELSDSVSEAKMLGISNQPQYVNSTGTPQQNTPEHGPLDDVYKKLAERINLNNYFK